MSKQVVSRQSEKYHGGQGSKRSTKRTNNPHMLVSSRDELSATKPQNSNKSSTNRQCGNNPDWGHTAKCRRLPCRSFVAHGWCPYASSCHFLHDPRLAFRGEFVPHMHKRRPTIDLVSDGFYWAPLDMQNSSKKGSETPSNASQQYQLPRLEDHENTKRLPYGVRELKMAIAVHSLWDNFLAFLETVPAEDKEIIEPINQRHRLPIFRALSQSHEFNIAPNK